MAPPSRRDAPSLRAQLLEKTRSFEFFQAVRLFRAIWPDREPVGRDTDPRDEVVHFRSDVSSVFPGGDVDGAVAPDEERPGELTVSFMGVSTPASWGSLPRRYAEEVRRQERENRNSAPRGFFDLFNHRLISLFYRAVEKTRPALAYETGRENDFERALRALLGLETAGLAGQTLLDNRVLMARAGLLAMRPLPASALENVLHSVFGLPVEIEQFVSSRYAIDADDQNRLGRANCTLGEDLHLGAEVRLVQSKFRVRLGPLDGDQYAAVLPDRPTYRELVELVRFAVGPDYDFEVELVPQTEHVRALHLRGPDAPVHQLGWSSWLVGAPKPERLEAPVLPEDRASAPMMEAQA